MVQWLRVHTPLKRDPNSVPSVHMGQLTICNWIQKIQHYLPTFISACICAHACTHEKIKN